MLITALLWLYTRSLRALPAAFHANFAQEMAAVFQESLEVQAARGAPAVLAAAAREFGSLPLVLWRVRRHAARRQQMHPLGASNPLPPLFQPPADTDAGDGRTSWRQTVLECGPLLLVCAALLVLTYAQPPPVAAAWQQRWRDAGAWVCLPAVAICLLGVAHGLPRWSCTPAGLLLGCVLFTAPAPGMLMFWIATLLAAYGLLLAAVYVHLHGEPLPPALQRLGRSLALDWTRASFGFYAMLPFVIVAAFDNTLRNDRTACYALALLATALGAVAYCRSRRQQGALAALAGATTAVIALAALEQSALPLSYSRQGMAWLAALAGGMLALYLLPAPGSMLYRLWRAGRLPQAER